jgi:hypothetical protein
VVSEWRAAGFAVTSELDAPAFAAVGTSCCPVCFGVVVAGPGVEVVDVDADAAGVGADVVEGGDVVDGGDVGVCAFDTAGGPMLVEGAAGLAGGWLPGRATGGVAGGVSVSARAAAVVD